MPDPAESILRPLAMSDRLKAAAWDVFHQSQSPQELQGALDALPLPDEAKSALLSAKGGGAQSGAIGRFVGGAAEMLNPVAAVQGLYQAGQHPIDTLGALGGAQLDQLHQAAELARQGRGVEAVGRGMAGLLPVIGPAAAGAGERIAGGDVAGGLGNAAGLLAPMGVRPAFNAARGVMPGQEAAAAALERAAANRYSEVMAPKIGPNKTRYGNMADKVAPELAANPEMASWSRQGLQRQVEAGLEGAEQGLDAASDARISARTSETKPVLEALKTKRAEHTIPAVEASHSIAEVTSAGTKQGVALGKDIVPAPLADRVAMIDQAIGELEQLGPVTRYEPLRKMRQAYDIPAKTKYAPSVTTDFLKKQGEASGAADVTGVLREHLATLEPETAEANATYHLMKTARDVLKATEEVERTRPRVGRQIIARMTGTMAGGQAAGLAGAVAGYTFGPAVEAALTAGFTTKLQTAQLLTRLAGAIRSGETGAAQSVLARLKKLAPTGAVQVERLTSQSGYPGATEPAAP